MTLGSPEKKERAAAQPLTLEHPKVRAILIMLRLKIIAEQCFAEYGTHGPAMAQHYLTPLLRAGIVKKWSRGLYALAVTPQTTL